MAIYKVIQDIEAEDKLVGPLSLKGFIYAIIAMTLAYLNFRILLSTGFNPLGILIVLILSFPMFLFGVLASPLGRDQPTEVWLLSHVRYFLKPRKRTWDQAGVIELVTITAPKKVQRQLTKNFSPNEVNSRLQALAMTLDSRGWAVKNVNINLNPTQGYSAQIIQPGSDRLVTASNMPQDVSSLDIQASEDILDEQNNPTAQNFARLMQQAETNRRIQTVSRVNDARGGVVQQPVDFSFLDEQQVATESSGHTRFVTHTIVGPEPKQVSRIIPVPPPNAIPKVTGLAQADKIELIKAAKNDKVSTLAKLANRRARVVQNGPNEVEITLHSE
ncbi:PrgI family protein [Candidatus Saccharibacteria bacterium]|nr:PrgI family protein [Candidatus Saccharibacteria bacterium]